MILVPLVGHCVGFSCYCLDSLPLFVAGSGYAAHIHKQAAQRSNPYSKPPRRAYWRISAARSGFEGGQAKRAPFGLSEEAAHGFGYGIFLVRTGNI